MVCITYSSYVDLDYVKYFFILHLLDYKVLFTTNHSNLNQHHPYNQINQPKPTSTTPRISLPPVTTCNAYKSITPNTYNPTPLLIAKLFIFIQISLLPWCEHKKNKQMKKNTTISKEELVKGWQRSLKNIRNNCLFNIENPCFYNKRNKQCSSFKIYTIYNLVWFLK